MTSFLKQHYPKGCVTIEGRRIYESFNRSTIRAVERNPYVPNQTTLSPIRNWRALEVMLYIYWNSLEPNPLYDQDFERIGCWLCPASLQSEFSHLKKSHPQLHAKWTSSLHAWAEENKLDSRYIDWGFWRWRRHPPKMIEIAKANDIELQARPKEKNDIKLEVVQGARPAALNTQSKLPFMCLRIILFLQLSGALNMLGKVSYAEDLGAAVIKSEKGRATVFANGQLMVIAQGRGQEAAGKDLRDYSARADVHGLQDMRAELQARGYCGERYIFSLMKNCATAAENALRAALLQIRRQRCLDRFAAKLPLNSNGSLMDNFRSCNLLQGDYILAAFFDCINNAYIAGAAAEITNQGFAYLLVSGIGVSCQKRCG